MKQAMFCLLLLLATTAGFAQNYNPVVNYAYNGTPAYGVKIKTKLPYTNSSQMPTITIEGYNYGGRKPIGLTLVWYIYDNIFWYPQISSFGDYTPTVKLANENGFVTIYIDDRQYYNRFTIRAYASGISETSSWFTGWTIVDEPIGGANIVTVPYANAFAGTITFPNGSWNENGNVLIGKTSQTNTNYKLDVAGKVRADEITVNTTGADFVFEDGYLLRPLHEVEAFIKENKHLPDVAPAKTMQENGVSVGEMNAKLLQKIEELTLYLIKKENEIKYLNEKMSEINQRLDKLSKQ